MELTRLATLINDLAIKVDTVAEKTEYPSAIISGRLTLTRSKLGLMTGYIHDTTEI